jgi:hypothetical protein
VLIRMYGMGVYFQEAVKKMSFETKKPPMLFGGFPENLNFRFSWDGLVTETGRFRTLDG